MLMLLNSVFHWLGRKHHGPHFHNSIKLGEWRATAFISAMFSLKTGCQVSLNPGVQVAAPNGKVMPSESACLTCAYSI